MKHKSSEEKCIPEIKESCLDFGEMARLPGSHLG